jgi:hypothetical protein
MLLPHPKKMVFQNEKWFFKDYFHDTPAFTLAYHSCQKSFCTDAMNLFVVFVERLLQIGCRVWTGLS